jgi:hypothetical protein
MEAVTFDSELGQLRITWNLRLRTSGPQGQKGHAFEVCHRHQTMPHVPLTRTGIRRVRADGRYILRRLLLMIPTIVGIMAISFAVIQFAPGGPVEQVIAQLTGQRGAQGLDPEFIAELERQFGFDKPPLERFCLMMWNYARFDFGESYFRDDR